jgi:hypothetical protein
MNLVMARSAALAGVIATGAFSSVLVCEPARADYYAFANSQDLGFATLSLTVGNTTVDINTDGFQGWISTSLRDIPGDNYMAGVYNNASYNDYFGFNLSSLRATATVSSAKLTVYSGLISEKLNYTLFGVATQSIISELETGLGSDPTLFQDLVAGPEYDISTVSANATDPTAQLTFTLGGSAVADINAAIRNRSIFAISGHVDLASAVLSAPVPEPSTWALMLAGFAGLGVMARRAARRRAAASAG